MANKGKKGSGNDVGRGVGEGHAGAVISLLCDGVKSKASTWFQILQYPYVNISNIIFDVHL